MSSKKPAKNSLQANLDRLEEIVRQLEDGTIPLENAVELYEEGIALSKECAEKLKAAELKIRKLTKSADGKLELEDLE
ncbi:MAG: exodeoxyribonuclease VII small subunit [Ignavibacteriales bacterium]|nr:exodeoxyribonuclease VII small subunit [Ignavibacteriales bacterium]